MVLSYVNDYRSLIFCFYFEFLASERLYTEFNRKNNSKILDSFESHSGQFFMHFRAKYEIKGLLECVAAGGLSVLGLLSLLVVFH